MTVIAMRERLARRTARASEPPREERLAPLPAPTHAAEPAIVGNTLTPPRLTATLYDRNRGYLQAWIDLADEAREKSPHLHSQLAIREQSVVETEFCVVPGDGSDARGTKANAKRAVAACTELFTAWQRRAGLERGRMASGWRQWVAEMVAGSYYARSAHEVLWERVERVTRPTALELIDTRYLSYACDERDPERGVLRLWDESDPAAALRFGVPITRLPVDKLLVNEVRVRGAQRTREGLFSTVVWWWLFYVWDWRDVMAAIEMLGRPPIVAYYAAGGARQGRENELNGARNATPAEVAAATKAVKAMTGALRATLADTTRLEAMKLDLPGGKLPGLEVAETIDRLISKAINGVANLSDLQPGARAAVEAQERVSFTFWRSDCRMVEELGSWLFERFIRANPDAFGADTPAPRLKAQTDPPKDLVAAGNRIAQARANGQRVPEAWAHEESGIPLPKPGERCLGDPLPGAPTDPRRPARGPGRPADDEDSRDPVARDAPDAPDARQE